MTEQSLDFHVVIPSRMASTRLPNKPLIDIHGKPLIQWVYESALKSKAKSVIVATDDEKILKAVASFGGEAVLTKASHQTGTDRIVEVCEKKKWGDETIVVNCQGDEPLMPAENLSQVAELLLNKNAEMSTLHKSISASDAEDPNLVKIVCANDGKALFFSRSVLPFDRDHNCPNYLGHIGLYAYKVGFLKTYSQLLPCELEKIEKLEQLRALYYGHSIFSQMAQQTPGPGVDTPKDLEQVIALMQD